MVAFDPAVGADENAAAMDEAIEAVATGAVTIASRDVQLNGVAVRKGTWLGLADGRAGRGRRVVRRRRARGPRARCSPSRAAC